MRQPHLSPSILQLTLDGNNFIEVFNNFTINKRKKNYVHKE